MTGRPPRGMLTLKDSYEQAKAKGYENLETFGWYLEDYNILQGTREESLHAAARRHLEQSGVPVESSKGEWGPGQHELNLRYAHALEMSDRHALYKHGLKEMAHQQGLAVTFMAKWRADLAGSGMHLHLSLWDQEGERHVARGLRGGGPRPLRPLFPHRAAQVRRGGHQLGTAALFRTGVRESCA